MAYGTHNSQLTPTLYPYLTKEQQQMIFSMEQSSSDSLWRTARSTSYSPTSWVGTTAGKVPDYAKKLKIEERTARGNRQRKTGTVLE